MSKGTQLFISRMDLAARWGFHHTTLIRMEKAGRLEPVKITPGRTNYRLSQVEEIEHDAVVDRTEAAH